MSVTRVLPHEFGLLAPAQNPPVQRPPTEFEEEEGQRPGLGRSSGVAEERETRMRGLWMLPSFYLLKEEPSADPRPHQNDKRKNKI